MYTNVINTPAQQIARLKKGGGRSFSKAKRPFQFFVKLSGLIHPCCNTQEFPKMDTPKWWALERVPMTPLLLNFWGVNVELPGPVIWTDDIRQKCVTNFWDASSDLSLHTKRPDSGVNQFGERWKFHIPGGSFSIFHLPHSESSGLAKLVSLGRCQQLSLLAEHWCRKNSAWKTSSPLGGSSQLVVVP